MARRRAGRAAIPGCRSPPTAATSRSSPGPRISFQATATAAPTCSSATASSAPPNGSASGRAGPSPTGRAPSGRCRRSRPTGAPSPSSPTRPTSSRTTPTARPTSSSTTVERAGGAGRAQGLGRTAMRSRIGGAVALAATLAAVPAWAGETTRVSVTSSGAQAEGGFQGSFVSAISAGGRYVLFTSDATNLVRRDTNGVPDVFLRDRAARTTERVSIATGGAQQNGGGFGSFVGAMSPDGHFVAFNSDATNLVPTGILPGDDNVFVRDREKGMTELESIGLGGAAADSNSGTAIAISNNGRFVAFDSDSTNLVKGDTNGVRDIFVRDRATGRIERVSVRTNGAQGNQDSGLQGIGMSADGRYVAFESSSTNLVPDDTNRKQDVFVHNRRTGRTERVSLGRGGRQTNGNSFYPSISGDGRYVVFESDATNLVKDDTNGVLDVFAHDRKTGTTERVSVGPNSIQTNGNSYARSISRDGRYVTFSSTATNLVPGDTNQATDAFVHDRVTGTTERVNLGPHGIQGNGPSAYGAGAAITPDGRLVAFDSDSSNLVPNDTNGFYDVFVIRFPADAFGAGSCGLTQPVGWASACGRRTRGGGGGALERGGAGGTVPRRGGRPLGPARPGDLAAGEGSRGGRGGRDDRVWGAVGRKAGGAVQPRGSGRARRPATGQRDETDDPEAGAARPAAAPAGGAAARRRAVDQSRGRGVDGGGAGARLGGGPARLGGAAGGRLVGPGAAAGASGAGHGGRAGGV